MQNNFQKCLDLVLKSEGGWVDGDKIGDPGGETNLGVTKKVWEEWVGPVSYTHLTLPTIYSV